MLSPEFIHESFFSIWIFISVGSYQFFSVKSSHTLSNKDILVAVDTPNSQSLIFNFPVNGIRDS